MLPTAEGALERVAHAYSFVNPPQAGYHEFYMVLIPQSRLTPHLQQLQVGDTLWLARQASGFLTLDELPAGCRSVDVVDRDGDRAFPVAAGGRWHRGAPIRNGAGTWGALG